MRIWVFTFARILTCIRWCRCEQQKKKSIVFPKTAGKIKFIFSIVFPKTEEKLCCFWKNGVENNFSRCFCKTAEKFCRNWFKKVSAVFEKTVEKIDLIFFCRFPEKSGKICFSVVHICTIVRACSNDLHIKQVADFNWAEIWYDAMEYFPIQIT